MLLGIAVGLLQVYGFFHITVPDFVLPTMIFFMLFFTFLRISPREMRLYSWHGIILLFQVVVSLALFYILRACPLMPAGEDNLALAQGVALCVLMPAATAAPIVAAKIGGSVLLLTPFTLLSSMVSALLIPVIFPLWNPEAHIPFAECFLLILKRVGPMLILPALVAWTCRLSRRIRSARLVTELPYYLWMGTLVILMFQMTLSIASYRGSYLILLYMTLGAIATCLLQFYAGKWLGLRYDPVTSLTAGQALGQKNTTLGVWLAQTYLIPISALAPAAYIIAQNLFNAIQIALFQKKH